MGIKLTMVHKSCMAVWLFRNNHFALVLNSAQHPKNLCLLGVAQQKGTCFSHKERALKEITALKVGGNTACAVGVFSPKSSAA